MPQAGKSSAWPTQFLKSNGLIWPSLRAAGPTAGRPGLSGTLEEGNSFIGGRIEKPPVESYMDVLDAGEASGVAAKDPER